MKRAQSPSFLLELPLRVDSRQAKHLHGHFEAARCLYNALLSEAMQRLRQVRSDPGWQAARDLPRNQKQQRATAFEAVRGRYGFTEYGLHEAAKRLRTSWIAEHIDIMTAQNLASRAYQAANRVCLGQAKRVRYKSRGRGLDSVEGKWNKSGLKFRLQDPAEGNQGFFLWGKDQIPAIIDWNDEVIVHGLRRRVKYCRVIRRRASSPRAQGADQYGFHYSIQLVLEGHPYQKPKNAQGRGVVGLDLGPSTVAIVPEQGPARLLLLAEDLTSNAKRRRRLQRKLDRQRRANNFDHYDACGRIKPRGQRPRRWKESRGYQRTRRRLAHGERRLAAHRRSLHGQLANEIVRQGDDIRLEKLSYRSWQRQFGRSVSVRAPGRFVAALKCSVARTGTALHEIPTHPSRLSQLCHACGRYTRKPLDQRFHCCPHCGLGASILIQRDLYSAWLATQINPLTYTFPSRGCLDSKWQGMEASLSAALVDFQERTREGKLPQSIRMPGAGVRWPERLARPTQELV